MNYFGTDGIRGVPNKDYDIFFFIKLVNALKQNGCSKIVIATDTRYSKDMIKSSIIASALSQGINIFDLGVCQTPCLVFYSKYLDITGIMITASHNRYSDNGIKIFLSGSKLSNKEEQLLENYICNPKYCFNEIGVLNTIENKKYVDFLNEFNVLSNYKIIIDCANGATYNLIKNIKLSNNMDIINDTPTGYNINDSCGSTNTLALAQEVINKHYDFGFAYDGDGDRLIVIDKYGNEINGDKIIYLFAIYLKNLNKLKNNSVVLTKVCNKGIINALNKNGIEVILSDIGDKEVLNMMKVNDIVLGGETSGHIILSDYFLTGDAILNTIIFLKMADSLDIYEYLDKLQLNHEKSINIEVLNKKDILKNKEVNDTINKIKNEIKDGTILVRPSGTENLIRVYISTVDKLKLEKYINLITKVIEKVDL